MLDHHQIFLFFKTFCYIKWFYKAWPIGKIYLSVDFFWRFSILKNNVKLIPSSVRKQIGSGFRFLSGFKLNGSKTLPVRETVFFISSSLGSDVSSLYFKAGLRCVLYDPSPLFQDPTTSWPAWTCPTTGSLHSAETSSYSTSTPSNISVGQLSR